jgi:polysaccharide biosynthesis transport protein
MEIKQLVNTLRRWWWLLLLAPIIAGVSSYVFFNRQPKIYSSRTTLVAGRTIRDPNPNASQIYLDQQLASIQADIAMREPISKATMQALGLSWLPEYTARALANTPMIEITVQDTDPQRAAAVANELANQLILNNPSSDLSRNQERLVFVNNQLDQMQKQIDDTLKEIEKLNQLLGTLDNARQIQDTQTQLSALGLKLTTLQGTYANLLAQTQSGAGNSLSVIEKGEIPSSPTQTNPALISLLTVMIAFMLAVIFTYLFELLDNTLKTEDDIKEAFNVPVIGQISVIKGKNRWKFVSDQPRSYIADDFRTLRTNLEFFAVDQPLKTILITSSSESDGKSIIAANLAQIMTQIDKKVILVDADLRSPDVHHGLGINQSPGLSNLITNSDTTVEDVAVTIVGDLLTVITAGTSAPNPTELVSSMKMDNVLEKLKEMADIVILDGPPYIVPDAAILSSKVDGIIVVASPGNTHRNGVVTMKQQIQMTGARLLGVVINRSKPKGSYYYGSKYRKTTDSAVSKDDDGFQTDLESDQQAA